MAFIDVTERMVREENLRVEKIFLPNGRNLSESVERWNGEAP